MSSSIRAKEIEKFSKDASHWWDEAGPFAPLHRLNPVRMGYIRAQAGRHFGLSETNLTPFKGLKILDIGCGGGLVCEPLARLGADVTGIDADGVAIGVAKAHAEGSGLEIDYRATTAEHLSPPSRSAPSPRSRGDINKIPPAKRGGKGGMFDIVLALEIIEHVESPEEFVGTIARLVKPGGLVIFSTLNRTVKSFALGIVAAEYVLGMVPRGTHSWKSFVRPSELAKHAQKAGLTPEDISGLVLNPLSGNFEISKSDVAVNYFMSAINQ